MTNNTEIDNQDLNTFYMQIHRSNLADYINRGIIVPARYIDNRTEEDVQNRISDFILLSNGYFDELNEDNLLLEIILNSEEKEKLLFIDAKECLSDGLSSSEVRAYFYPLPITRIKNIYINKKRKKLLQDTIKTGDIGYLSENIFTLFTQKFTKNLPKYESSKLKLELNTNNDYVDNRKDNLLKYNKIMGMFTFVKNTNLYFSDSEYKISNYSNYYFNFLSLLNTTIKSKTIEDGKRNFFEKLLQLIEPAESEAKLSLLINKLYSGKQVDKNFINEIIEAGGNEELLHKLFDPLEIVEALKQLTGTEYYAAYLYWNRFSNDIESLKNKILDNNIDKAEILLAMFGLYYGYSNIRAKELIGISDKFFKKFLIGGIKMNMKFLMNSKLDYITIESIYQYVFNGIYENNEFSYLEYPKYKKTKEPIIPNLYYEKIIDELAIDVPLFKYKFTPFEELVKKQLDRYPDHNQITDKYYLYKFYRDELNGECKSIIKANCRKNYTTKDDFLDSFDIYKDNLNKTKEAHLLSVLEMDKKYYGVK